MKKIAIMNGSDFANFWPIQAFTDVYKSQPALAGCSVVSLPMESADPDPDKVALVVCRTFIENSDRAKNYQKYVVGIRFYSYGDMATIDVISLDEDYHRDICFEHLKRMNWPTNDYLNQSADKLTETTVAPFVFVGGHLQVTDGRVSFSGASGDYGSDIFFSDSNAIAAYVASVCGIEITTGEKEKGEMFIQDLLEFMLKHKMKKDFYECLVDDVIKKTPGKKSFTAQHMGSLITMKAWDRSVTEEKEYILMMIEEIASGGLSRHLMLSNVVKKMKETTQ